MFYGEGIYALVHRWDMYVSLDGYHTGVALVT